MTGDKRKLIFSVSRDLILSIFAIVLYNGVIQLVIYPRLEEYAGAEAFGNALYIFSAVSIMGAGFGTSASYSRMVARRNRKEENGDYNLFLLIISLISIPVTAAVLFSLGGLEAGLFAQVLALMILTVVRYYADVEYRMNIRFMDYFIFFAIVSAGYIIGLLFLKVTQSCVSVLIFGEILGIVYTFLRGSIFRAPYTRLSESFKENMRSLLYISAGNLLGAIILHSDRLLLRLFTGAREVTVFYAASLMGKFVAMLTTPLNGVIIGYLTNYNVRFGKRKFATIVAGLLAFTVAMAGACTLVSRFFVRLMYPDVFSEAKELFFMANLGQVLYFISGSLLVIIMSFTKEKLQLLINSVYAVIFCAVVIPAAAFLGINGIAYGLIAVNLARFFVTALFGMNSIIKNSV